MIYSSMVEHLPRMLKTTPTNISNRKKEARESGRHRDYFCQHAHTHTYTHKIITG